MKDTSDQDLEHLKDKTRVLGDINPKPDRRRERSFKRSDNDRADDREAGGGPDQDKIEHSGSRDVTEGTTGGAGTETGGTRNFRTGSGAVGTDIGNRPE
jgi:hypothetical protein